eukprot:PITA_35807
MTEQPPKPPLQCWGCGESQYYKNCPHKARTEQLSNMEEDSTVGDIPRSASLSYIIPKVVEKCLLPSSKFKKSWLVQLTTRAKRKVSAKLENCPIIVSGNLIHADLNILPLGSYDVLIGMDQLEGRWSLVDCKKKSVSYLTELGQRKEIQGIQKSMKLCPITANQLGKCIRKHCQIYNVQVRYYNDKNKMTSLEKIRVIQEFEDVFLENILGLPPRRDIDFTTKLIPGVVPVSKALYRMSVLELTKLKM